MSIRVKTGLKSWVASFRGEVYSKLSLVVMCAYILMSVYLLTNLQKKFWSNQYFFTLNEVLHDFCKPFFNNFFDYKIISMKYVFSIYGTLKEVLNFDGRWRLTREKCIFNRLATTFDSIFDRTVIYWLQVHKKCGEICIFI